MVKEGFRERDGTGAGHDIPVVVRGNSSCPIATRSLLSWRARVASDDRYPRVESVLAQAAAVGQGMRRKKGTPVAAVKLSPTSADDSSDGGSGGGEPEDWFCSLGNGHFFQALNLFGTKARSIFTGTVYDSPGDEPLARAVGQGVEGIVLRAGMDIEVRSAVIGFIVFVLVQSFSQTNLTWPCPYPLVTPGSPRAIRAAQFYPRHKMDR